jgi:putative membrane protein
MTPETPPPPGSSPGAGPSDHELLEQPARQSPFALVFIGWKHARRLGVSGLVAAAVFIVNGGLAAGVLAFLIIATAGILLTSTLGWYRFTFAVIDDELVVTRGIAAVERLVIPLDRVQGVAVDQRPTHRLFDLVSVSVDTAGSSSVEFEIDAIDRPRAEALRRLAADARRTDTRSAEQAEAVWAPPVAPDRLLLERSARDLALVGVTRVPLAGLIALAPLIALFDEVNEFIDVESRLEGVAERTEGVVGGSAVAAVLAVVIVVVAVTVIGALLQTVREILTNWNLRLYRTPTGLRRTAGLLTTTSRSSTIRRVQTLTTDDSPPQRWLGITHARLRAFGDNDISLPGSSDTDVEMLRQLVFAALEPPLRDRMISRWYVFRSTRNGAAVAAILTCALWFAVGAWSLLAFLLVPCWWLAARRRWRLRRWGITTEQISESYELLARHTAELPLFKAQVVSVSQSLFERRKGLASVEVRTADGYLRVPMIDEAAAAAVRDRVLQVVVDDRRRFL